MTIPNVSIRRKYLRRIPWNDGEVYDFCYEKCFRSFYAERDDEAFQNNPESIDCREAIDEIGQRRYKEVYYGYFVGRAPGNLKHGVYCYLKRIHALPTKKIVNDIRISGFPQTRERNELLPLEGAHLRKPLAVSTQSMKVAQELEERFDCQEYQGCYVVERPYRELNPKTVHQELTIFERLEYLDQLCEALLELYQNQVHGKTVCAYRDLKLGNGLIKPGRPGKRRFTVVLTDFATIRFQDDAEPIFQFDLDSSQPSGSGDSNTIPFLMSPDNTAPETLLNAQNIDSKIDVYALAQILAILFGYIFFPKDTVELSEYKNLSPNHQFYIDWADGASRPEEVQYKLSRAFERARELDEKLEWSVHQKSWLEWAVLKPGRNTDTVTRCFCWGNPEDIGEQPSEALLARIRKLFFDSSRIDPAKRPTVEEFQTEICALKDMVMQTRSSCRTFYDQPQSLYLFHLPNSKEWYDKEYLIEAASQAMDKDPCDIRLYWYGGSGENTIIPNPGSLCLNTQDMTKNWDMRDYRGPIHGVSIAEALAQACRHYESAVMEYSFSGDIHVFTLQPINKRTLGPASDGTGLEEILNRMYDLSRLTTNRLRVWFHSPGEKAAIPRSFSGLDFRYKRIRMPSRSVPEPAPKPQPVPEPKPEPESAPVLSVEQRYPTGPDGLFFLHGGNQIFVGRRKERKVR